MKILGVRYGHDASAALIIDGQIVADVAEERFTRIKNDTSFPINAIEYCLKAGGINAVDIDCLAIPSESIQPEFFIFFSMPESINAGGSDAKNGLSRFLKSKLNRGSEMPRIVLPLYRKPFKLSDKCRISLCHHHLAHAASACYTSGLKYEKALIFTMDGIGEGVSAAVWRFEKNKITSLARYGKEASLGYFYSNITEAMGWKHGCDEWKVMGLAPYGAPTKGILDNFHPVFRDGKLIRSYEYGEYGRWNDHGSNHYHGKDAIKLSQILRSVSRENFAAEAQGIVEEQAFNFIMPWLERERVEHACFAGGFFLNVKFNQKLWYTGKLKTQWIYPNPGDAGIAVGAALYAYYMQNPDKQHDRLTNLYFGPEYSNAQLKEILDDRELGYEYHEDIEKETAKYLAQNMVVGWFQGRMESGPRALGNRSILMSPLKAENKDLINLKVKYREPFRPFCPSILSDKYYDYLKSPREELFMVTSFDAKDEVKDRIPAVIHKDGTARPQMVRKEINERYYKLVDEFGRLTGEYVLLNTSFNIRGEPIVCNPREAIKCFYDTGLDILVLGNYLIKKPKIKND